MLLIRKKMQTNFRDYIYFIRPEGVSRIFARGGGVEQILTHLYPPLRSTFTVRETASLGIMGEPRVPPLNPSETIVMLCRHVMRLGGLLSSLALSFRSFIKLITFPSIAVCLILALVIRFV